MEQNSSMSRFTRYIINLISVNRTSSLTNNNQQRIITINNEPQSIKFLSNRISTSKYSILTFLPKFFFEQFRKYSNLFFLIVEQIQTCFLMDPESL